MTRKAGLLFGLALVASCSLGSPASAPGTSPSPTASAGNASGCARLTVPHAPAGGPPPAVLRDLAAGPNEFLIGSPGGSVDRITEATSIGLSVPRLTDGRLFFSVGQGTSAQEIRTARFGECSSHFGTGTMTEVDLQGRALVVGDGGHWRMLDASGRTITEIDGPGGVWTGDGHLVQPARSTDLKVYDLSGTPRNISLPAGSVPSGPLGASQEIVATPTGMRVVDVRDGKLQPFPVSIKAQRLLSGSPDGDYIAFIDADGNPQVVGLRDGRSMRLPAPGPPVGAVWERQSQWVAVQSPLGGAVMRVADGKVVETGGLVVVSW